MNSKLFWACVFCAFSATSSALPLDDYVQDGDPTFSWFDTGSEVHGRTGPANGNQSWTGRYLNVTSQSWLTPEDSSRPIWWHMVLYITADDVDSRRPVQDGEKTPIMMYITGHSNGAMPDQTDEDVIACSELSLATGFPVVVLFNVPNEGIVFPSDPLNKSRTEDAIIAFTWDHYLNDQSDPTWVAQLPMVKSVIRVQDAIEEYLSLEDQTEWVVAGASKRGWTTWLSAAADANYKKRIKAIVPMVYDMLNFQENLHHQYRAYGGWTFAFHDYYEMNITGRLDDPNSTLLYQIVDPWAYKERLTMPKLVVDATGDEFFTTDDWAYWVHLDGGLPGVNHFLMNPNTEHSLSTGVLETVPAICAFVNGLYEVGEDNIPQFDWQVDNSTGDITVTIDSDSALPSTVEVWYATTCNDARRDFRLVNIDDPCTCGIQNGDDCINTQVLWSHKTLDHVSGDDHTYVAHMDAPTDGTWLGFFVDLKFRGLGWPIDSYNTYEFSTQVSIIPNDFPFEDCEGSGCYGTLV